MKREDVIEMIDKLKRNPNDSAIPIGQLQHCFRCDHFVYECRCDVDEEKNTAPAQGDEHG